MTGLGVQEPRAMIEQRMCAPYAMACAHQALGTASRSDAYLLFEMPLPWPATLYQSNADFRTLREMRACLWESGIRVGVIALAPIPAYSEAGFIRMVYLRRPGGAFDRFVREEYRVPAEIGAVPLARALLGVPERSPVRRGLGNRSGRASTGVPGRSPRSEGAHGRAPVREPHGLSEHRGTGAKPRPEGVGEPHGLALERSEGFPNSKES